MFIASEGCELIDTSPSVSCCWLSVTDSINPLTELNTRIHEHTPTPLRVNFIHSVRICHRLLVLQIPLLSQTYIVRWKQHNAKRASLKFWSLWSFSKYIKIHFVHHREHIATTKPNRLVLSAEMILFIVRSVWNTNSVWAECKFVMLKQTVHIATTVRPMEAIFYYGRRLKCNPVLVPVVVSLPEGRQSPVRRQ
jgi:hypothetical protein